MSSSLSSRQLSVPLIPVVHPCQICYFLLSFGGSHCEYVWENFSVTAFYWYVVLLNSLGQPRNSLYNPGYLQHTLTTQISCRLTHSVAQAGLQDSLAFSSQLHLIFVVFFFFLLLLLNCSSLIAKELNVFLLFIGHLYIFF